MDVSHGLKMNLSRREIQVLLLHEFRVSSRATEPTNNICSTMDDHVVSILTAQHWFNRFKNGTLKLDDLQHSGRTLELGVDLPKQLIEENLRLTSLHLAEQFGCSHTMVEKHLNELGKTWRYGVLTLHELSSHQLQHRVDVCTDFIRSTEGGGGSYEIKCVRLFACLIARGQKNIIQNLNH